VKLRCRANVPSETSSLAVAYELLITKLFDPAKGC
jgi:hypothetical protein